MSIKEYPKRVILLSDTLESPTLDNLWNYLGNFYDQLSLDQKDRFYFEDLAGIYTEDGKSRLFAVCTRYGNIDGLKVLPPGKYLCAGCDEALRYDIVALFCPHCKKVFRVSAPEIIGHENTDKDRYEKKKQD